MWLEVLYWIDHVWSSKECVCCACGPGVRLDDPSICLFVFLYVGSYILILEFESWITGVLMLFLCVILHTMSLGKSPWYVLLVCHQYDICDNYVGSVYISGYGGLSKADSVSTMSDCIVC